MDQWGLETRYSIGFLSGDERLPSLQSTAKPPGAFSNMTTTTGKLSGQIMIFHQTRFSWNTGISLPKSYLLGGFRLCFRSRANLTRNYTPVTPSFFGKWIIPHLGLLPYFWTMERVWSHLRWELQPWYTLQGERPLPVINGIITSINGLTNG